MALDGLTTLSARHGSRIGWPNCSTFPASKHDDQCDAMGLCGQLLDQMVKGRAGNTRGIRQAEGWLQARPVTGSKPWMPMTL